MPIEPSLVAGVEILKGRADRRARIVKTMCAVPDYVAIATTKAMAAFDARISPVTASTAFFTPLPP